MIFMFLLLLTSCYGDTLTNPSLKSNITALNLTSNKTNIIRVKFNKEYLPEIVETKVMAVYKNGDKQEVTDKVSWQGLGGKMRLHDGKIVFYDENNVTLKATYHGVESNPITITVQNVEHTDAYLYTFIYNEDSERFPQRDAGLEIQLVKKPTSDVLLTVRLKSSDKVGFEESDSLVKTLRFKRAGVPQAVTIIDKDINNTQPYTLYTDAFESNDSTYANVNPKDIVVTPHASIELIEPPLRKRKGAIRGVRVQMLLYAKSGSVHAFRLVNPPKGMRLAPPPMHTINEFNDLTRSATAIVWDVPMDIEEKTYNITVEAIGKEGKKGTITFPIKVPKTNPIQTEITNNELIVTDIASNLYGMKMKGHHGEDISQMKLRSVAYEYVWKKRVKNKQPRDVVKHIVFILDNMPEALDVKMPEWMDSTEKVLNIGARFLKNNENSLFGSFWKGAVEEWNESKGPLIRLYKNETLRISKVFLISIEKWQKVGK